jgi:hypothetical protein
MHDRAGSLCLEANTKESSLHVTACNQTNLLQKWEWSRVNNTMVDNWQVMGAKLL